MDELLERTWWVAGSPCSGKSTLAARFAAEVEALLYSCDDAFDRHGATIPVELGPTMHKVTTWSVQDRLAQPVDIQVADVLTLCREEWPSVLADLRDLSGSVVVEGAALLPELLATLGVPPGRAVVVVPTETFQREHYARRSWAQDLVGVTDDPATAFERWMQRDACFANTVAEQARTLGYQLLVADGTASVDDAYATLRALLSTRGR